VRNYSPTEWKAFVHDADLKVDFERVHSHAMGKKLDFLDWTGRMHVSSSDVQRLRSLFLDGPKELRDLLEVSDEGNGNLSFTLPELTLLCHRDFLC
jgi:hypothetical protein